MGNLFNLAIVQRLFQLGRSVLPPYRHYRYICPHYNDHYRIRPALGTIPLKPTITLNAPDSDDKLVHLERAATIHIFYSQYPTNIHKKISYVILTHSSVETQIGGIKRSGGLALLRARDCIL